MRAAPVPAVEHTGLPSEMRGFVRELGIENIISARPLTGGVSSDIWLIETRHQRICIKRALSALRVAAEWHAPIERSAYEYAWMQRVQAIVRQAVPRVLGRSADGAMFAMEYLDPQDYPLWKGVLLAGKVDIGFAGEVGGALAAVHSATARDASVPAAFPSDPIFYAIRLEPYLLATARRHPDLSPQLNAVCERTARTKRALVHGDVSPKNILVGAAGPVFLDAECAWYGDPAFDVSFCLNHLLLKCIPLPRHVGELLRAFNEFTSRYFARADWEDRTSLEQRCATLLPALTLARIDGKSPVEYIVTEIDKQRVREIARALILKPLTHLSEVAADWHAAMAKH